MQMTLSCIEEDQLTAISQLQNYIFEISNWMNRHKLKLNEDKTEFLIAGTSHQHAKVMINSLSVSGAIIPASPCVKNLGVITDSELTLSDQVTYICKSCYHYLRNYYHLTIFNCIISQDHPSFCYLCKTGLLHLSLH